MKPQKTIITTVTLGVHDPDGDMPEVRDASGNVLSPAIRGLGHAAPGMPVTLDADEADRILARWGGEVVDEDEDAETDEDSDEDAEEPEAGEADAADEDAEEDGAEEQQDEDAEERAEDAEQPAASGRKPRRQAAR
ncbi:hypothetical protein D8770_26285 [Methylobacterium sp. DB1607]|nr:hypothetical protein [Methylobacterium sp. DB1607]